MCGGIAKAGRLRCSALRRGFYGKYRVAFEHSIEGPSIHAEDLGRSLLVPTGGGQDVRDVLARHFVQRPESKGTRST